MSHCNLRSLTTNSTIYSLVSTILFYRPDLSHLLPRIDNSIPPIPLHSHVDYFKGTFLSAYSYICTLLSVLFRSNIWCLVRGVPEVGELMLASFPLSVQPGFIIDIDHPWYYFLKFPVVSSFIFCLTFVLF